MEQAPRPPVRVMRANTPEQHFGAFKLACAMHEETDFKHFTLDPELCFESLGKWMQAHDAVLLVAVRDADVVGMAAGRDVASMWFTRDRLFVEDFIYTRADERGSRTGYMLWRELVRWANDRGLNHKRSQTATGIGEGAERLYEHAGMYRVGSVFASH